MIKYPVVLRIFTAILVSLFATQVLAQDQGFSESAIAFNLRDISASGTFVPLSDDQESAAVPIGFTFNFYGNDYSEAYISSNGYFAFTQQGTSGCCSGENIPDPSTPNNLVAGFWEDLNLPQGEIRYETLGAAPNREFVVGFYDNPHFFDGVPVTFEMIIHETSNNVEFQLASASSDGGNHTVGVENEDGTLAYLIAYGDVSFQQQAFLLSPEPIDVTPVPTLRGTMLGMLVLLLAMVGVWRIRKERMMA